MTSIARRAVALLVAVCALWTLFAGPPLALMVGSALGPMRAAAATGVPAADSPTPARSCACLRCGAGGPGHAAGKSCCCEGGPVLAAEPAPDVLCLRSLCDTGAPDVTLTGVSPCPPAILPALVPAAPAPVAALLSLPAGASADAAAPSAALAHPEAPPRAAFS